MTSSLDGRVVIVTGAARGLGRAEAVAFAARGARVVVVDVLDASDVVAEIERSGGAAVYADVDLSTGEAGALAALDVALTAYGDVDVVVNNAGVLRDRMSFNLSAEDWDLVLDVNLSASFHLAQAATRHWRARHADGERGRWAIVNTSSESGLYGNVGQANYAAAKAGVAALTITLATELDRYGIRVNAIAPRARTPMAHGAFGDLPTDGDYDPFAPEHVAEVVAWLASDAAGDITGQVLVVHGGGVQAMRPWSIRHEITRRGPWTEEELATLPAALFPGGETRQLARPVGDLFTIADEPKEMMR